MKVGMLERWKPCKLPQKMGNHPATTNKSLKVERMNIRKVTPKTWKDMGKKYLELYRSTLPASSTDPVYIVTDGK